MSLNRYEQVLFDYWDRNADERRHWQGKVVDLTRATVSSIDQARTLERELWDYLVERSHHVASLRDLRLEGVRRVSLLNLAEHIIRLWGPPPKPRPARSTS
ncbi:MAG TPA: hypothetical protein VHN79_08650 [Lacunisphaera sp.]|nr:hypothetical protein [Lacunisphaera sp.]